MNLRSGWVLFFAVILSATTKANSIEDFLDRPVEVYQIGVKNAVKFYDVLSDVANNGQIEPLSPYFRLTSWHGICLRRESGKTCERSYQQKNEVIEAYRKSYGLREYSGPLFAHVQPESLNSKTTYKFLSKTELRVSTTKNLTGNRYYKAEFSVKKLPELSDRKVELQDPISDQGLRSGISSQGPSSKELANSVIQIAKGPFEATDLLGNQISSGTGFFISYDGLLLTNYHVISSYPSCLSDLTCEITFRQTNRQGKIKSFNARVDIYAESEGFDFALMKVSLPGDVQVYPLEIEKELIGPELISVGYPGDQKDPKSSEVLLTFSRGLLTGFNARTFATSVFVFSGASGSPLLNSNNSKIVGIISNTAGQPVEGIGTPGLARPIDVINAEFDIDGYVTGRKQERISNILLLLKQTSLGTRAQQLMNEYIKENTLYGARSFSKLMVEHANMKVRKQIFKGLQANKVIRGAVF